MCYMHGVGGRVDVLLTGSFDGEIRLWDVVEGVELAMLRSMAGVERIGGDSEGEDGHNTGGVEDEDGKRVTALCVCPDPNHFDDKRRFIVVGRGSGWIDVWSARRRDSYKHIVSFMAHEFDTEVTKVRRGMGCFNRPAG